MVRSLNRENIGSLIVIVLLQWGYKDHGVFSLARITMKIQEVKRKRYRMLCTVEGVISLVLAISPTMKCNYPCSGCYVQGKNAENKLSSKELEEIFQMQKYLAWRWWWLSVEGHF